MFTARSYYRLKKLSICSALSGAACALRQPYAWWRGGLQLAARILPNNQGREVERHQVDPCVHLWRQCGGLKGQVVRVLRLAHFTCLSMLQVRLGRHTSAFCSCVGTCCWGSRPLGMQETTLSKLNCRAAEVASNATKCAEAHVLSRRFCTSDEQADRPCGAGGNALMATRAARRGRRRASAPPTLASCSPAAGSAAKCASQGMRRHILQHSNCGEGRRVHLAMDAYSAVLAFHVSCLILFLQDDVRGL